MTEKEYQAELDNVKLKKNALMLFGWIFSTGIAAYAWSESWSNNDDVNSIAICYLSIIAILGGVLELDAYLTRRKLKATYSGKK